MQLIISRDEKLKLMQCSMDSVKRTFFTDDLVKPGSYISLKSSDSDFLNAVCFTDCQNDVNADDEFLLSLRDKSGNVLESQQPQPRFRVLAYMQQYLTGNLAWQDELEWNKLSC